MAELDKDAAVGVLNRSLEAELAGVVRYTHYAFLVFGFGRIPIVSWLNAQADESLLHARQAGEWITTLGAYPSLGIGALLDSHQHDVGAILRESLETECQAPGPVPRAAGAGGGPFGGARGVRAPDDPCRGAAPRRCRQDAAQAGRTARLFAARDLG